MCRLRACPGTVAAPLLPFQTVSQAETLQAQVVRSAGQTSITFLCPLLFSKPINRRPRFADLAEDLLFHPILQILERGLFVDVGGLGVLLAFELAVGQEQANGDGHARFVRLNP